MTPQAIIFDMDGLLLDTEKLYLAAYRTARTTLGMAQDDAAFMAMIGMNGPGTQAAMQSAFGDRASEFDAQWSREITRLFSGPLPVKSGVRELVTHLKSTATPYAIATSTATAKAHHHLEKAGLSDLFSTLIGGDQVQNGKPAPDIYLLAARTLGIDPTTCAAFEDSENGVRAALGAGMTTVQIPDVKHPDDAFRQLGHHIAPTLLDGARMLGIKVS